VSEEYGILLAVYFLLISSLSVVSTLKMKVICAAETSAFFETHGITNNKAALAITAFVENLKSNTELPPPLAHQFVY
jgi:hypothetical protein